jgi:hypothetical protein
MESGFGAQQLGQRLITALIIRTTSLGDLLHLGKQVVRNKGVFLKGILYGLVK